MGGKAWSDDSYAHIKRTTATQTQQQVFTQSNVSASMNPKGVKMRESRDSVPHPNTVAIQLYLDETGSMGSIPEVLVKEKLGALMNVLIKHGVPDAQVLFGGVGDHYSDEGPLQVGQFEDGTDELVKCLQSIWLEGNGGGQRKESYALPWLFAGRHTSIDCFEKRGEKGFLFTVGDEGIHELMERDRLEQIFGYKWEADVTAQQALKESGCYHGCCDIWGQY